MMPYTRFIDGNAIGWRLHCAADVELHPDSGIEVQGARAFAGHLSYLAASDPECLNVIFWDGRAEWRYELHPGYKAGRHVTEQQREDRRKYEAVRPYMQRWASTGPFIQVRHPLMEADDLAFRGSKAMSAAGYSVELHTIDSDWYQLVDPRVSWRGFGKGAKRKTIESFEPDDVLTATAHVKALTGDSADSIDGINGIGDTRALQLLRSYGGLDALLRAARSLEGLDGQPKWAQQLCLPEIQALVERNRLLVELSRFPEQDMRLATVEAGEYDFLTALDLCDELGLQDWLHDFPAPVRGLTKRFDEGRFRTFTRLMGLEG